MRIILNNFFCYDRCPDYATAYDGVCYCDMGTMTFKLPNSGKLHCIKCLQCPRCEGSEYQCDNGYNSPYLFVGEVNCTSPERNYYVKHGIIVKCSRPCNKTLNERETRACGCDQDRKCECEVGFYRNHVGDCLLKCSPCTPSSRRVHSGDCKSMPINKVSTKCCLPFLKTFITRLVYCYHLNYI